MILHWKTLTLTRWKDFETLFGKNGACGGCWCMHWKLKRGEFFAGKAKANREKQKSIVSKGITPGIILYDGEIAIGWCAVEPRKNYPVMENSRVLKQVDDKEVWSVSCFFILKEYRNKGLSVKLLEFVKEYCKKKKAAIIEGYPYEVSKKTAPPFVWTGLSGSFLKAGFKEIARHSASRPIMRYYL